MLSRNNFPCEDISKILIDAFDRRNYAQTSNDYINVDCFDTCRYHIATGKFKRAE